MTEPLLKVIGRVRRAMPRNPDVMRVCEEAERMQLALRDHIIGGDGRIFIPAVPVQHPIVPVPVFAKARRKASRLQPGMGANASTPAVSATAKASKAGPAKVPASKRRRR